jgi:hypothetical protein
MNTQLYMELLEDEVYRLREENKELKLRRDLSELKQKQMDSERQGASSHQIGATIHQKSTRFAQMFGVGEMTPSQVEGTFTAPRNLSGGDPSDTP